jgi:hypothetical protein
LAKKKESFRNPTSASFDSEFSDHAGFHSYDSPTSTISFEIFVSAYETGPISEVSRTGTAGHSREGQQGSRKLEHPIVQGPVNDPEAFHPSSSVYPRQTRDLEILDVICCWGAVDCVWKLAGTPGSLVTIAAEGFGTMRN